MDQEIHMDYVLSNIYILLALVGVQLPTGTFVIDMNIPFLYLVWLALNLMHSAIFYQSRWIFRSISTPVS